MTTQPIIEVHGLSAGYDGRTVLHDIDLTVYENDFLGIIGPNGGGKTTLIKCILGLLKPTAGKITYNISTMGYLPQYNTIDRKFPISVEEVILSGLSSNARKCVQPSPVWDWKAWKAVRSDNSVADNYNVLYWGVPLSVTRRSLSSTNRVLT